MCTGINNFLNTFSSAVVQMMFWGTCWWMLDELLLHSPFLISVGCTLLFFWSKASPVIWTITVSHTPLVSGWWWNTATMLLKSDRAAGEEKQWRCVIIIIFCALWVCIYMCEWSISLFVCVCFYFPGEHVHCWSALSAWVLCIYVIGLAVSYPHI